MRKELCPDFGFEAVVAESRSASLGKIQSIGRGAVRRKFSHIQNRLEDRAFDLEITDEALAWLLRKGTSRECGARELKRTILRNLTQPLAAMVESGKTRPSGLVKVGVAPPGESPVVDVEGF
jgi:ATP-dependent Clp protease ATP-binding subunit ClpA